MSTFSRHARAPISLLAGVAGGVIFVCFDLQIPVHPVCLTKHVHHSRRRAKREKQQEKDRASAQPVIQKPTDPAANHYSGDEFGHNFKRYPKRVATPGFIRWRFMTPSGARNRASERLATVVKISRSGCWINGTRPHLRRFCHHRYLGRFAHQAFTDEPGRPAPKAGRTIVCGQWAVKDRLLFVNILKLLYKIMNLLHRVRRYQHSGQSRLSQRREAPSHH